MRTIIGDAHALRRNLDRLAPEARAAVVKAARAAASQSGKALPGKRGEKIECSFAHVWSA